MRSQFAQQSRAHMIALVWAEGVHRGPVARAEHHIPEEVRVFEGVFARNSHFGGTCHPGARVQVQEGLGGRDLIPGIEGPVQRRFHLADRFPEQAAGWLEEARSPGGDRQDAAGPDQSPHLRDERRHVRHEKVAEDAHTRVKAALR